MSKGVCEDYKTPPSECRQCVGTEIYMYIAVWTVYDVVGCLLEENKMKGSCERPPVFHSYMFSLYMDEECQVQNSMGNVNSVQQTVTNRVERAPWSYILM